VAKEKFSLTLMGFLSGFDGFTALAFILGVLLVCGLGVPIPEDITLIAAGILAGLGKISLWGALIAGFIGVLLGDCILFFMGRIYGARVFQLPGFRKVFTESRIKTAREKVLKNSKVICFTARFLPGLRAPIYLTAGMLGVKPAIFLLLDGFAALISVPIWVVLGWYLGENIDETIEIAQKLQVVILAGLVLAVAIYVVIRRKKRLSKKSSAAPTEAELN